MGRTRNKTFWIVASLIIAIFLCCCTATGLWLFWSKGNGEDPLAENVRGDDITFRVVNETPEEMCAVYLSPRADDHWGASRGGIPAGASLDINVLAAGHYDFFAVDCAGIAHASQIISPDSPLIVIGGIGKIQLHVKNASEDEICYLQAAFTYEDEWGNGDLLGAETLSPHSSQFFYLYPGDYDLRTLNCNGDTLFEQFNVTLAESSTWVLE